VAAGSLPEGVTQEDIKDPDNMANMTCMTYIEKRLAEQQTKIQHCASEGIRIPPAEKDKLMALTKQKFTLQAQVNSGKMSEEQYKDWNVRQLAKDGRLL
jgi:hypothetical protein